MFYYEMLVCGDPPSDLGLLLIASERRKRARRRQSLVPPIVTARSATFSRRRTYAFPQQPASVSHARCCQRVVAVVAAAPCRRGGGGGGGGKGKGQGLQPYLPSEGRLLAERSLNSPSRPSPGHVCRSLFTCNRFPQLSREVRDFLKSESGRDMHM